MDIYWSQWFKWRNGSLFTAACHHFVNWSKEILGALLYKRNCLKSILLFLKSYHRFLEIIFTFIEIILRYFEILLTSKLYHRYFEIIPNFLWNHLYFFWNSPWNGVVFCDNQQLGSRVLACHSDCLLLTTQLTVLLQSFPPPIHFWS